MSVENSDFWLTADQVRQALNAKGLVIPQSRLDRQRTDGLLPPARRRGRGQGRGRGPAEYPAATPDQAAILHGLLSSDRNIKRAGWRLWLSGFQVAPEFWFDELQRSAEIWDEAMPHILAILDDDDDDGGGGGGFADLAAAVFQTSDVEGVLKSARKALGLKRFEEFLHNVLSICIGAFTDISSSQDATDPDRRSASRNLDIGLGLASARDLRIADGSRFLDGDFTSVLADIAVSLGDGSMRQMLTATPDLELLTARNEIAFLFRLIDHLWGPAGDPERVKLSPLKSAGSLPGMSRPIQATMILIWLRYRKSPGVSESVIKLAVMVELAIQANGFAPKSPILS